MRHLKDENKWESPGSLDSNKLDIEGLEAAQRNGFSSCSRTEYNVSLKKKAHLINEVYIWVLEFLTLFVAFSE